MRGPTVPAGGIQVEESTPPERADFHPGEPYFASRRQAFGDVSLGLTIGPLRMVLSGLSPVQAERLGARFEPFVAPNDAPVHLRVRLCDAGVGAFLRPPAAGACETYRLESRTSGGRVVLWSYEFAGWFDAGERHAAVFLVAAEGPLFDRGVENFLRVLVAYFSLDHGGFLLHGAGIVRGGEAHVFFGPSGSGKTTVCSLSPNDTVLSDDLTLIVRAGDRFEAAGIPFGLAHQRRPESRASFPISSFNRLIQAREVSREPLQGALGMAEILCSVPFVMRDPQQASRAVHVVEQALQAVPTYRLNFRKDDSFWSVVEGR